ncbi:response regulator [Flavitalea flava]
MVPIILLADDHSMIRRALRVICESYGFQEISEVGTCSALMKDLSKKKYSHVILDMLLTDGNTLEVLPNIQKLYPDLKIMIFSMQSPDVFANVVKQFGVHYYASKGDPEKQTIEILLRFLNSDKQTRRQTDPKKHENPFSSLSVQELKTLHYLLKGMTTVEIADTLNVKRTTIATYKRRILDKTKASHIRDVLQIAPLYDVN